MPVSKITSLSISSISKIYGIELSNISSIYGQTISIASTWLDGWDYRKSITLSRASGAVTNYQMKLLVGESSGATGEDVDCDGKCKTDFSDLRFTTSDKTTLLDYWIESISGTTPNQLATVWIEFDSIGTGATTFYMYYGNSSASAYSNGDNTFILFDDFNDNSLDTNKWEVLQNTWEETGQLLKGTCPSSNSSTIISKNQISVSDNFAIESTIQTQYGLSTQNYQSGLMLNDEKVYTSMMRGYWLDLSGWDKWIIYDETGSYSESSADTGFDARNETLYSLRKNGTTHKLYINGTEKVSHTYTWVTVPQYVGCYVGYVANYANFNNFKVRQYLSTEPAWGSWGTEENKWLDGWSYRKPITLSRATGAVTNYQMKLLVSKSASATGEDIDCNDHCLDNFDDIRFTTDNGITLLDYWIESVSNDVATIWIEFDSIGTSATTFYMYYGNSGASAYSNGDNTFPFFDHFEGDVINTDKWNVTGNVVVGSSEVTLDANDQIYGKTAFGLGYTVRTKVKSNEQDSTFAEWWYDINNRCSIDNSDGVYPDDFDRLQYSHVKNGSIGSGTYYDNAEDFRNAYAIYEVFRNSSSSIIRTKYGASNTYTNNYTNSTYIYTGNSYPSIRVWNSSQESTLIGDYVLIRKQVATEPAWGSWGTEETT